jgi:hypothetical protein
MFSLNGMKVDESFQEKNGKSFTNDLPISDKHTVQITDKQQKGMQKGRKEALCCIKISNQ